MPFDVGTLRFCISTYQQLYTDIENLLKAILNFRLIPVQTKCNAEKWANILLFFEQLTNVKVQNVWSCFQCFTVHFSIQ